MRTYTKNYDGSVTTQALIPAISCPKCDNEMTICRQSVPHYDSETNYSDCIVIIGVPGYYCADGCELFLTTAQVDLIVARDVFLIATASGLADLACEAYNEIRDLNRYIEAKRRKHKA